jgi:hypothetical protein
MGKSYTDKRVSHVDAVEPEWTAKLEFTNGRKLFFVNDVLCAVPIAPNDEPQFAPKTFAGTAPATANNRPNARKCRLDTAMQKSPVSDRGNSRIVSGGGAGFNRRMLWRPRPSNLGRCVAVL